MSQGVLQQLLTPAPKQSQLRGRGVRDCIVSIQNLASEWYMSCCAMVLKQTSSWNSLELATNGICTWRVVMQVQCYLLR